VLGILTVTLLSPVFARAETLPEVDWIEGPTTVDLGDIAQIELGNKYVFADGEDARAILEYLAEPVSNLEVGVVCPKAEDEFWAIWFDYDTIGYIKNDEKESLDSQAILKIIKEANDEQNRIRIERGFAPFDIIGWHEEPHYDIDSNNLLWSLLGESQGIRIVNYSTRLLGRHGYISVTLVTDFASLDTTKAILEDILAHFSWKKGKSYAEWVPGDRVAEIGLTALIAGGAGAAAAKLGLFGKIWKWLLAGAAVVGGAIWRLIKRVTGRGKASTPQSMAS